MLVALLGGLAEQVGGAVVVAVVGGFVGLAAIVVYLSSDRDDPGMTTEVALVVALPARRAGAEGTALAAARASWWRSSSPTAIVFTARA